MGDMLTVVGLGNPGKKYEHTVHNIGFGILDLLAGRAPWEKEKYANAHSAHVAKGETDFLLIKPDTFMNSSGEVLPYLQKIYRFSAEDLIVIHDDLDLPFGTVRVSFGRGSAGHNGVESIIHHLGTPDFMRIRVGVARFIPEVGTIKPNVIGGFMKEEMDQIPELASRIGKILELRALSGTDAVMTAFN